MLSKTAVRKYELDWLRVFAISIVFIYHSTRFFDLTIWHVKNVETHVWVEVFNIFITRWMMPLFFVISGGSLYFVIGKSGGWRKFYTDKFLRLMIPVLVASVTHSILQVYLERLNNGQIDGSLFKFYPDYFRGVYLGIAASGSGNFAFHGMHLWYLLFLFIYGLACYPLFKWFKGGGSKALNSFIRFSTTPGLTLISFIFPLVILKVLLPGWFINVGNGGWGFLYYFWFLISGFLILSSEKLQLSIKSRRWFYLLLGTAFLFCYLYLQFGISHPVLQGQLGDGVLSLLSFLSSWSCLFTLLGFAFQHLSFDKPLLNRFNEGVLPFFILHQTVLLGIGYLVIQWQMNDLLKWVIVSFSSFTVIVLIYTLLIRRIDLLRFLFGMKTVHPFFQRFQKGAALILMFVFWMLLILFAAVNKQAISDQKLFPTVLKKDPKADIVLTAKDITLKSNHGVQVVNDASTANGQAIEFFSGGKQSIEPHPEVFVEFTFSAPAGKYYLWMRGKSDKKGELADSVWLQVDQQLGTRMGSVHLGNWNSFHPVGVYAWAGDLHLPLNLRLMHSGFHKLRIQPRQTPHRIDQVWLSRWQNRIPKSNAPIR